MNALVATLVLAAAWIVFFGNFSWLALLSGLVLGHGIVWLLEPLTGGPSGHVRRVWAWVRLLALFLYELVVSSLQVFWDVVTPRLRARPALIEVPLEVRSDMGILLVTNLISLTPGTLSIDVSPDRRTLLIHAMFAEDPEAVRRALKSGMERWVIEAVEERT